tara:strand:- start:19202 stop:19534 length:333 start_codon:yes stop_codon:yes gene_type:complete
MTQSLTQEIKEDKYSRAIIQALVSQVHLAITQFNDDCQNLNKHSKLNSVIDSVVDSWYRIEATYDFKFQNNFIESAILGACGDIVKGTFHDLGLNTNSKLSKELNQWLYE